MEAASGFVGFGFSVCGLADASDFNWVAAVVVLVSGIELGCFTEFFLLRFFCVAALVVPSISTVFVPLSAALFTSSATISLFFLAFDFFSFCCFGSDRGNTPNPVKLSMNWQIISIAFFMGAGRTDEARIDFIIICTALLLLDAPPLVVNIVSDIARDFTSNNVPVG